MNDVTNPFLTRIIKNYNDLPIATATEELIFWQAAMLDLLHAPPCKTTAGENQLMNATNYVDMKIQSCSVRVPLMAELNKITSKNMDLPSILIH